MINFLYILRSSGPRRVHRHQCYTTYWGHSWCKMSTVQYLPIGPLHFTGGQKLAHNSVNLGPRHISETITGRKLKFYTHRQGHVLLQGMKISTPRRCAGVQRPLVQIWDPPPISEARVHRGVTQKGKSGKFLIYPPFQRPTPSTPPPMLYHLLGP